MSHDLEEVLSETRLHGPRVLLDLHVRLMVEEAQELASVLKQDGYAIEAYDFPRTQYVWLSEREDGIPYTQLATRQLIIALANQIGVDPFVPDGFKLLLPHLDLDTFTHKQINNWETTLGGLVQFYGSSPSTPVLELVAVDKSFVLIKEKNLQPLDFSNGPKYLWIDKVDRPTATARSSTKQLIKIFARQQGVDYQVPSGLAVVCAQLSYDKFIDTPINFWETNLSSMLSAAYGNGVHDAVIDLVAQDAEFEHMRGEMDVIFPKPLKPLPFLKPVREAEIS